MCMAGSASVLYEPGFGRLWPVVEGRDEEYLDVKAWVALLAESKERQDDIEGKKWPAPPPKGKPAPVKPASFIERVLGDGAAAPSNKPPSNGPEPRGVKAAWPWLAGMFAALVLGLLLGVGIAKKRHV